MSDPNMRQCIRQQKPTGYKHALLPCTHYQKKKKHQKKAQQLLHCQTKIPPTTNWEKTKNTIHQENKQKDYIYEPHHGLTHSIPVCTDGTNMTRYMTPSTEQPTATPMDTWGHQIQYKPPTTIQILLQQNISRVDLNPGGLVKLAALHEFMVETSS